MTRYGQILWNLKAKNLGHVGSPKYVDAKVWRAASEYFEPIDGE
jgi:hypothetical protein